MGLKAHPGAAVFLLAQPQVSSLLNFQEPQFTSPICLPNACHGLLVLTSHDKDLCYPYFEAGLLIPERWSDPSPGSLFALLTSNNRHHKLLQETSGLEEHQPWPFPICPPSLGAESVSSSKKDANSCQPTIIQRHIHVSCKISLGHLLDIHIYRKLWASQTDRLSRVP